MPANLTPVYLDAEARFKSATTTEDKIAYLEEMLAVVPKHKGTDRLRADLRKKLSKLKSGGGSKAGKSTFSYAIDPEGAGQIFLAGPPNTGKSAILDMVTNLAPAVADYPFTTQKAEPGMLQFEDVAIQLVDTPPLSSEYTPSWLPTIIREGDGVAFVVDPSAPDVLERMEDALAILHERKIHLTGLEAPPSEATTRPGHKWMDAFLVAAKMDKQDARDNLEVLLEMVSVTCPVVEVSILEEASLTAFGRACYDLLEIIRVYSKMPSKPPDYGAPFVVPRGTTLIEFAGYVHKDFRERFDFAKLWREGVPDGIRISRDETLEDGDVVELHMS